MPTFREEFILYAESRGISKDLAEKLFDQCTLLYNVSGVGVSPFKLLDACIGPAPDTKTLDIHTEKK